jgi:hypothetical protein
MDSYQWYRNGAVISGATLSSYTTSQAGTYTVVVSKSNCTATSAGFVVNSLALPTATITPSGADTIASTATQNIVASTGTGFTYRWFKNGAVISGATASTYSATVSGIYKVEITQNGCIHNSANLALTKNTVPIVSGGQNQVESYVTGMIVTLNGSASDSDGTIASYLWTKVSGPAVTLSGTSTSTLQLSNLNLGTYGFQLRATDNFGESTTSGIITVTINQNTNDYNYIATSVMLVPGITNASSIETLNIDQKSKVFDYFDGLGRPMQSVNM